MLPARSSTLATNSALLQDDLQDPVASQIAHTNDVVSEPRVRPPRQTLASGPRVRPSCQALVSDPRVRPSCQALVSDPRVRPSCQTLALTNVFYSGRVPAKNADDSIGSKCFGNIEEKLQINGGKSFCEHRKVPPTRRNLAC